MIYEDGTILNFSMHKGKRLESVPASWLLWYVKQENILEGLKTYILNKKSQLEFQEIADKQKEKAQRKFNSR